MFPRVLTGTRTGSRRVHGFPAPDKLKSLSIFANSFSATPIPSPGIKGFTGLISISYNKVKGVHGFTGPEQCGGWVGATVQGSRFEVQSSKFRSESIRPNSTKFA